MYKKNHIRDLRIAMSMKQEELAHRCGVKQGAVSTWENGQSTPKPEAIRIMTNLFGVSMGYLLGYEDETPDLDISDIDFALSGEIRDLTEDEKRDILDYVRFKRAQKTKQVGRLL